MRKKFSRGGVGSHGSNDDVPMPEDMESKAMAVSPSNHSSESVGNDKSPDELDENNKGTSHRLPRAQPEKRRLSPPALTGSTTGYITSTVVVAPDQAHNTSPTGSRHTKKHKRNSPQKQPGQPTYHGLMATEYAQFQARRRVEQARLAEEARLAEQALRAEEARLAEEARQAEEARLAEQAARRAAQARLAHEAQDEGSPANIAKARSKATRDVAAAAKEAQARATPSDEIVITGVDKELDDKLNKVFTGFSKHIRSSKLHATLDDMREYVFYWDTHFNYLKYRLKPSDAMNIYQYNTSALWTIFNGKGSQKGTDNKDIYLLGIPQIIKNDCQYNKTFEIEYGTKVEEERHKAKYESSFAPFNIRNWHEYIMNYINQENNKLIRYPTTSSKHHEVHKMKKINKQVNDEFLSLSSPYNVEPFMYNAHFCNSDIGTTTFPLDKDCCVCYLCGQIVGFKKTKTNSYIYGELDHIIPVVISVILGVHNTPINYAFTHKKCNGCKSDNAAPIPGVGEANPFSIVKAYTQPGAGKSPAGIVVAGPLREYRSPKYVPMVAPAASSWSSRSRARRNKYVTQAHKSARFFDKLRQSIVLSKGSSKEELLKWYIYSWLGAYFQILSNGMAVQGGAPKATASTKKCFKGSDKPDCSTLGDPSDPLYPYKKFLCMFQRDLIEDEKDECYTSCEARAMFMKSRYENLFKFSVEYITKWQQEFQIPTSSSDQYSQLINKRIEDIIENMSKTVDHVV